MPLVTQIKRGDQVVVPDGGWDYIALSCMYTAAMKEAAPETIINDGVPGGLKYGDLEPNQFVDWSMSPIYYMEGCPLLEIGQQILREDHTFNIGFSDGSERKIAFKKGDVLKSWRESS